MYAKQAAISQQHREKDATTLALISFYNVDVNDQDALGRTPLHLAAAANHAAALKCLLLHGADPDLVDDAGETPIETAQRTASSSAARILSDASVLFWNSSVRANRLYNDKRFDVAIVAYTAAIKFASDKSLVRVFAFMSCWRTDVELPHGS